MIRSALFNRLRVLSPYPLRQVIKRQPWFVPLSRVIFGNEVYCESYYKDVERLEGASVPVIAEWIREELRPQRVIDIGCGPGHLARALADRGIEVFGVDISDQAIAATRAKGLACEKFDLTIPGSTLPDVPYDLAVSCEVAEHLEEKYAARFVGHLCAAARTVYLTAAEPDPSVGLGLYHMNEQPNEYWIKLFEEQGYVYDKAATGEARRIFAGANVISYLAKPMVFRKG